MLTIFSSPRPFTEQRFAKIQLNSVKSWLHLEPKPRIILLGDRKYESGIEMLADLGCEIVGKIKRNQWGTPLVGDMLIRAQNMAKTNIVAWINTDLIMLQDFMEAIQQVEGKFEQWLLIGAKWRLYGKPPEIDFNKKNWQRDIRRLCERNGDRQPRSGSNYQVFTNGLFQGKIYKRPVAWGRIKMDTWLVWQVLKRGIPVIDATDAILAVHQDHRHLGKKIIQQNDGSEEIKLQYKLTERRSSGGGRISNATWILDEKGLRKR